MQSTGTRCSAVAEKVSVEFVGLLSGALDSSPYRPEILSLTADDAPGARTLQQN